MSDGVVTTGLSEPEFHQTRNEPPPRVALITGATRASAVASRSRLARDGFDIAVNGRDAAAAESVASEIEALGRRAVTVPGTVADRGVVFGAVQRAVAELGRLDVIVANAGVIQVQPITEIGPHDLDEIFGTNLYGAIYSIQAAASVMEEQGGGKIILGSSVSAYVGDRFLTAYCATKFGLHGVAQSAARELAPLGITVNLYCPGIVPTDMWTKLDRELGALLGNADGETLRQRADAIVLGRTATPDDIAGAVSFLASRDSDYMTGQSVIVDGGLVFR